jgi:hypothetical protein
VYSIRVGGAGAPPVTVARLSPFAAAATVNRPGETSGSPLAVAIAAGGLLVPGAVKVEQRAPTSTRTPRAAPTASRQQDSTRVSATNNRAAGPTPEHRAVVAPGWVQLRLSQV